MSESSTNRPRFEGFKSPNYTMVPDELFDELLADLSGAELKVLLYIIRRTFGFKKGSDRISKAQLEKGIQRSDGTILDRGTGLSRRAIRLAVDSLVEQGILLKYSYESAERGFEATEYALHMATNGSTPWVHSTQAIGKKVPKGLGRGVPTQKTVLQETEVQERDPSNVRKGSRSHIEREGQDEAGERAPSPTGSSGISNSLPEEDEQPAITWASRSQDAPKSSTAGFQSVGDVIDRLGQNNGPRGRITRQKSHSDARQRILAYIEDFAIELGDEAPLPSSVSRAYNLYVRSGADIGTFTALMYEARALTKEYTANITKTKSGTSGPFGPQKNKMAYFFSILEHRLGLAGDDDRLGRAPE